MPIATHWKITSKPYTHETMFVLTNTPFYANVTCSRNKSSKSNRGFIIEVGVDGLYRAFPKRILHKMDEQKALAMAEEILQECIKIFESSPSSNLLP